MVTNRAKPAQKFRPVLTAAQIEHILYLAKTEQPSITAASMSLISTLSPFQAKIANAGIQPAYTMAPVKPKAASIEGLGGDPFVNTKLMGQSKEMYWADCYNKFSDNPALCNLDEIAAAKEHMYLNDLMSPAELAEFETSTNDYDKTDSQGNLL